MTTRKLCHPCAKDTAVYGRCERLSWHDKPGTICDRCLNDGRLLASYRICCEPESRYGHTDECRKARKKPLDPVLQRFAVALFATDPRVIALVEGALAHSPQGPTERLGRAWDLAADGHEPEATCRKEAEERAVRMQTFDRELSRYAAETKRLTRESQAKAALKAGQEANARLAPPMPRAEHDANVARLQAAERERNLARAREDLARRQDEDERKRQERAERKAEHPQCGAKSPIGRQENLPEHSAIFQNERCTRQKHDYGDHQYIVNGRVISGWNANSYYVGDDPAKATSRTKPSVIETTISPDTLRRHQAAQLLSHGFINETECHALMGLRK